MASSRDSSARSFLKKAGKYAGRAHEKVKPGALHAAHKGALHLVQTPGGAHDTVHAWLLPLNPRVVEEGVHGSCKAWVDSSSCVCGRQRGSDGRK